LLVSCTLTTRLVLIADSEEALQKMMLETTNFLKKWRFSVSAKKTQVVACGNECLVTSGSSCPESRLLLFQQAFFLAVGHQSV
jgi:hypothetical protein